MAAPLIFETILAALATPVVVFDRDLCFAYANEAYCRSVHRRWEELRGQKPADLFPESPERMDAMRDRIRRAFEGEPSSSDAAPYQIPGPDGQMLERYWRSRIVPLYGPDGRVTHVIQSGEDVTDEVLLRRQKDVIASELEHRVRNTLAMVGSLAVVTGQHTPSVEAFVETFTDRLEAMSRNLFMISDNHWRGLPFRTIVEAELAQVIATDDPRLTLEGPELILSVRSTKWVALLTHELVTNAVRYGCFSVPGGRLSVRWSLADGAFTVDWVETGRKGTGIPERRGFGSQMLDLMPNVVAERNFRDEGLALKITVTGSFYVPSGQEAKAVSGNG
ncbi:MAG: sensor histidine kinase [Hyphomonas sp.]|jgi:PAS domain S-box-containing protein